jgi:predicted metal-dependent phosphoesterase TrpH
MMSPPLRWVPCELHAHSVHSDGRLTVAEMAWEARALGLDIVALTDHNTNSGLREIPEAERASGVAIIPGMELTTFYGHLLAWGTTAYEEWRSLSRVNVDSAVAAIHAGGGLAGVAHPFNPGSPFCTGCFWDFEGPDWDQVDFLEVWSETDPWTRP